MHIKSSHLIGGCHHLSFKCGKKNSGNSTSFKVTSISAKYFDSVHLVGSREYTETSNYTDEM